MGSIENLIYKMIDIASNMPMIAVYFNVALIKRSDERCGVMPILNENGKGVK